MKTFSILSVTCFILSAAGAASAGRPPKNDPEHLLKPVQRPGVVNPVNVFRPTGPAIPGATGPSVAIPANVTFSEKPIRTKLVPMRQGGPEVQLLLGPTDPQKPTQITGLKAGSVGTLRLGASSFQVTIKKQGAQDEISIDMNRNGTIEGSERHRTKKHRDYGNKVIGPVRAYLKYGLNDKPRKEPYLLYMVVEESGGNYTLTLHPGGGRAVSLGGTRAILIDENVNGRYGEYGVDSIIIGRKSCSRLQPLMTFGKKLFYLSVPQDGMEVKAKKFDAGLQKADLASGFKGSGKVTKFLVTGGGYEFDLAQSPFLIPGKYALVEALIKAGGNEIKVSRGAFPILNVTKDAPLTMEWGKPVGLDFFASKSIAGISISALVVKGSKGELYDLGAQNAPTVQISGPRSMRDTMATVAGGGMSYNWDPGASGKYKVTVNWSTSVFGRLTRTQEVGR